MAEKSRFRPVVEEVPGASAQPPQPEKETPKPSPAEARPEPVAPPPPPPPALVNTNNIVKPTKKINLKLILLVTIVTAIIVGVVAGAVYVFFSRTAVEIPLDSIQPIETLPLAPVTPTPTPSPTPEPVDISTLNISVLNGGGRIGEASKVANLLEEDGFVIEDAGNADRYDYEETVIQVSSKVDEVTLESIQSLLTNSGYAVEIGSNLPSSSEYDIVITVGQD